MADVSVQNTGKDCIDLPPGFRFHPTDEEIITHYLSPKVMNSSFSATAIGEVDLNKCEPWDLPSKAKMGEKEWYFFCQRDRKYPTGLRTNRATEAGYWKATGKDREIFRGKGVLVGMKKTLVFYRGRAPKGEKTNWVMHEFRLENKSPCINLPRTAKDEWVVCRVFHKNMGIKKSPMTGLAGMNFGEDLPDSPTLPPLMDSPFFNSNSRPGLSYVNDYEGLDFKGIPASSSSMPSYFSNMVAMEDLYDHKSYLPNNFSSINHQVSPCNPPSSAAFYHQIPPQTPYFPLPGPAASGYLHQDLAMLRALAATNDASAAIRSHCKVEQFSNQSMVSASQDTGLSTDRNTEISSVVSKREMGSCRSYDDLDDPTSAGPVLDLDNIWKY